MFKFVLVWNIKCLFYLQLEYILKIKSLHIFYMYLFSVPIYNFKLPINYDYQPHFLHGLVEHKFHSL